MNKLIEIKQTIHQMTDKEEILYLLSLLEVTKKDNNLLESTCSDLEKRLEDKDKALEGQHRYFERISVTFGEFECRRLAKEAMNRYTPSNHKGG